ncbi:MAG: MFS transporter [Microbacterium sp.]
MLVPVGLANGLLLAVFPLIVLSDVLGRGAARRGASRSASPRRRPAMSRSRLLRSSAHASRSNGKRQTTSADHGLRVGCRRDGVRHRPVPRRHPRRPHRPVGAGRDRGGAELRLRHRVRARTRRACVVVVGEDAGAARPMRAVFSAKVLVLVAATFAVGMFFGSTLTSLTAFAQARGDEQACGKGCGLMGIGSAVLALGVVLLPARFALSRRWIVFSLVVTIAAIGYSTADSFASIIVWLLLMGLGVGPTLVTLFSLAGARAPLGRAATTMTLLGSALTLAQALSSAFTGWLAEAVSLHAAMIVPAISRRAHPGARRGQRRGGTPPRLTRGRVEPRAPSSRRGQSRRGR